MNVFKNIYLLGNEPIKAYLNKALQTNLLHHTLLFSGSDGIGKSLFAKVVAQELLKASEQRVLSENHPDLHMLRPEGKSGTHPVELIREAIDEVHKPPFEAERKIFIICEAERMLPAAANALLKTLEEPDLDCQIILLSASPNEMLPTILSRCVHLTFQPIAKDLIASFLQEKYQLEPMRAQSLARLSNGSIGRAIGLMQNSHSEQAARILFDALEEKIPSVQAIEKIDALFDELEGIEFHRQAEQLLASYLMWMRDQELMALNGDESLLYFAKPKRMSVSLAKAEERIKIVKTALERNVKFSACLDFLLRSS